MSLFKPKSILTPNPVHRGDSPKRCPSPDKPKVKFSSTDVVFEPQSNQINISQKINILDSMKKQESPKAPINPKMVNSINFSSPPQSHLPKGQQTLKQSCSIHTAPFQNIFKAQTKNIPPTNPQNKPQDKRIEQQRKKKAELEKTQRDQRQGLEEMKKCFMKNLNKVIDDMEGYLIGVQRFKQKALKKGEEVLLDERAEFMQRFDREYQNILLRLQQFESSNTEVQSVQAEDKYRQREISDLVQASSMFQSNPTNVSIFQLIHYISHSPHHSHPIPH